MKKETCLAFEIIRWIATVFDIITPHHPNHSFPDASSVESSVLPHDILKCALDMDQEYQLETVQKCWDVSI